MGREAGSTEGVSGGLMGAWLVVGWVVDSDDSKAVLKAATMAELMVALTVG